MNELTTEEKVLQWFIPLSNSEQTLKDAFRELKSFGLQQEDVPFIIQLVENPKYDLPGGDIFHGSADIDTHDYIHILLGRGLLMKDEAFVIGFTMGSTNRVSTTEEKLYGFFSRFLYPKTYRFSKDDIHVFKDAVKLGFISDCQPLSKVDFTEHLDSPLGEIRKALGIEEDLLRAYYAIEKRRYPNEKECQRLLD